MIDQNLTEPQEKSKTDIKDAIVKTYNSYLKNLNK